ncbi:putative disease resistance protein RGA1 [Prunus yedoensis var. nudiflora]|uniref:Putative disease resistance protein RGA1 n=1 Tax=Prunus yedoensis var. nudiflora TaxID=2094558 RepID=A0A314XMK5_PRUYE|nr:putative disease resistance protein RGA1 [Prunus yedoensis var. nudiflora]
MPSGMESLYQLQTLPLFVASEGNLRLPLGLNLYGELNITRLENITCRLEKFILWGNSTDAKSAKLHIKKNLESLGLYWEWSSANVGNAFPGLKKLTIKSCPKLAHIPFPQSLQHLELRNCNPTMEFVADLSLLYVLILDKIPDLVYLRKGLFASASLSSLKILSCPKLHSMPSEMQNLSSLKSLTIRWCEELSSLPQSLQNLKALESLEISGCGKLTSLPDGGIAGLASLRTLSIENCSELTSLSSSLEQLTLLEDLTIMDCPKLGSFPAGVQNLSSLRSLMVLNCPWFDLLPEGLQNVKTLHCLEISSCDNLTALPEWFEDLASLRSLTIYDCPNLTLLPRGFKLLTKLQHLSIQECPELEERCRQGCSEDWSKIAHVLHKYIGSPQVRGWRSEHIGKALLSKYLLTKKLLFHCHCHQQAIIIMLSLLDSHHLTSTEGRTTALFARPVGLPQSLSGNLSNTLPSSSRVGTKS